MTQHGSTPAEQRCRYIFRYYVYGENSSLTDDIIPTVNMTFDQFKVLMNDINEMKKNLTYDEETLETEAINGFKIFGLNSRKDTLSLSDFLIGVGQLKFRGTSILFRNTKSLKDVFQDYQSLLELANNEQSRLDKYDIQNLILPKVQSVKIPANNESKKTTETGYELATHTVKVKRTGALFDIAKLWELDGATTPNVSMDTNFSFDLGRGGATSFNRFKSVDFFNQQSQPNEMLR